MPIRPQHRWLYPIDWHELSRLVRFGRAKGRCETCGRPHGAHVVHLGDGRWWDDQHGVWRDGRAEVLASLPAPGHEAGAALQVTRVVLATAHLNHDPTDNQPGNLRALCQRCHMLHDQPEHRRQRRLTLRARVAVGDLFLGRYRHGAKP